MRPPEASRSRSRPPPFFTAPSVVVALTAAIVAAHIIRVVLPERLQDYAFYLFALIPERLTLMLEGAADPPAYSLSGLAIASVGHVFLHVSFFHLFANSFMLLALGAPVVRRIGGMRFLILFSLCAIAGSVVYFHVQGPEGSVAVGASSAVSGVIAGALLLMAEPALGWPALVSRKFMGTSLAFLAANLALIFVGPAVLGMGIAWEVHIGGYVAGAVLMVLLDPHRRWGRL